MKNSSLKLVSIGLFLILITNLSCTKEDESSKNTITEQVTNSLKSGVWQITKFEKNAIDSVVLFSGITFTFQSNNIALSLDTANTTFNGTWSIRRIPNLNDDDEEDEEDEEDDGLNHGNNQTTNGNGSTIPQIVAIDNLEIVFNYNYTNNLANLNNKWKLMFQNELKIELATYNSLNSIDTYLVLEKK